MKSRIDDLEERVASLEKQCEKNNSNLESLQAIVNVLDQADFIKAVTPVNNDGKIIGYTLEFRKSPSITIYHGTDGKDAPAIGIKKDNGSYYWTLGDDWLLDNDGNRIRVNGNVTPQLKIKDSCWWVSYDNGITWDNWGEQCPGIVKEIREDELFLYITLFSGTEIRLPKEGRIINFEDATVKKICLEQWDTNKDGEISYDEAKEVTSLGDCFLGMGILYFNELEFFTGLEAIDENAFYKSGLKEITLPAELKTIGARAFYATPLESISIPETVDSIGVAAFYACRNLRHANIPASFTEVPEQMFAGCWSLQEIVLPENTVKIGNEAFHECFELADVALPATLDTLGNLAFARCRAFTEVILPESVRNIGFSAFYECVNARNIEFPDHIEVLDHMVVYGCQSMESFTVPSKVGVIGWYTFWECTKLKSLIMKPTVPPTVRTDNAEASSLFKNCPQDLVIYVPDVDVYASDPYWSRYTDRLQSIPE